ncbi:MAG: archaeosortase/exosortase family protein [Chthoniobacterales bacterium]|nr:archaeosortase/exosortase family protein [Chthoniobacterales bacterium]
MPDPAALAQAPAPITAVPAGRSFPSSFGWWAGLIFLGLLWFILCRHLSGEWSVNEQYSYGWFVPFFAAYLFWRRAVLDDPPTRTFSDGERLQHEWLCRHVSRSDPAAVESISPLRRLGHDHHRQQYVFRFPMGR